MKQLIYLGLIAIFVFGQISCDIINPEEEIPSYLKIESFELEESIDEETFGLASKIVAANVLVNDESVGVISIPGKIPVFAEGDVIVTLDPLVQENGADLFLRIYPFFERIDIPVTLSRVDSTVINVKTKYQSGNFFRGSTFSGSDEFFTEDLDGNGFTQLAISTVGGQAGQGSIGRIVLNADNPSYQAATSESALIDISNYTQAWLEVQYKSDVDFIFGVRNASTDIIREFGIRGKDEWNTIYFDAANFLSSNSITEFQLTVSATLPSSWSGDDAVILIDNVKFVYK
ncbi:MAG: hypothetical protein ACI85O_000158 [Saprospiraceae bacterium]|jgi:hypothetical protein